jgi:hypothetical protein
MPRPASSRPPGMGLSRRARYSCTCGAVFQALAPGMCPFKAKLSAVEHKTRKES